MSNDFLNNIRGITSQSYNDFSGIISQLKKSYPNSRQYNALQPKIENANVLMPCNR